MPFLCALNNLKHADRVQVSIWHSQSSISVSSPGTSKSCYTARHRFTRIEQGSSCPSPFQDHTSPLCRMFLICTFACLEQNHKTGVPQKITKHLPKCFCCSPPFDRQLLSAPLYWGVSLPWTLTLMNLFPSPCDSVKSKSSQSFISLFKIHQWNT